MTISLIDVDGHHFPNLALMKLSAWKKLLLQGGAYEAGEGEEKVYGAVEPVNGPGSCLWAREIGEFPAAVTKKRFCGK